MIRSVLARKELKDFLSCLAFEKSNYEEKFIIKLSLKTVGE